MVSNAEEQLGCPTPVLENDDELATTRPKHAHRKHGKGPKGIDEREGEKAGAEDAVGERPE